MQTSSLFHCLLLILSNQSLYFLLCLENDNYKHPKAKLFLLQSFLALHRIPDFCVLVGCTSVIVRNRYSVQQLQWEGEVLFTSSENPSLVISTVSGTPLSAYIPIVSISQKHRMIEAGRNLCRSSGSTKGPA